MIERNQLEPICKKNECVHINPFNCKLGSVRLINGRAVLLCRVIITVSVSTYTMD